MAVAFQVAFCGLYCGDCIIRQRKIGEASDNLLQTIHTREFGKLSNGLPKISPKVFSAFSKIKDCCEVLDAMSHLDCKRLCRNGGGTTGCAIRTCCRGKKIYGCWQCAEFEKCEILGLIKPVNGNAHISNLKVIKKKGMASFLAGEKAW